MSWDIYGNPLRRGYCEVHPDVHQEYPCSICMAQKQQQSQPHNELEQLQYEFAQQGDYIRHLESERAALAAQVSGLMKIVESNALAHISANTSEISAQAIEQAVTYLSESVPDKSHESVIFKDRYVYISTRCLREHAATIRQGGAE